MFDHSSSPVPGRLVRLVIALGLIGAFTFGLEMSTAFAQSGSGSGGDNQALFRTLVSRAQAQYKKGNYDAALSDFETAYEFKSTPALLYNMGLVAEKAGKLQRASDYYRDFVLSSDVKLATRKRVAKRLKVIRGILEDSGAGGGETSSSGGQVTDLTSELQSMEGDLEQIEDVPVDAEADVAPVEETAPVERAETDTQEDDADSDAGGYNFDASPGDSEQDQQASGETDAPIADDSSGDAEQESEEEVEMQYNVGWPAYTVFGGAALSVLGGVGFLSAAKSAEFNADEENDPDLEAQAETYSAVSTSLFVAGAALTGVGIFLLKSNAEPKNPDTIGARSTAGFSPGPRGAKVFYRLRF